MMNFVIYDTVTGNYLGLIQGTKIVEMQERAEAMYPDRDVWIIDHELFPVIQARYCTKRADDVVLVVDKLGLMLVEANGNDDEQETLFTISSDTFTNDNASETARLLLFIFGNKYCTSHFSKYWHLMLQSVENAKTRWLNSSFGESSVFEVSPDGRLLCGDIQWNQVSQD